MLKLKAKFNSSKQGNKTTLLKFYVNNDEVDFIDIAETEKQNGWLYFANSEASKKAEELMKQRNYGISYRGKSLSQILRHKIMLRYEAENPEMTLEAYYDEQMNFLITEYNNILK